MPSEQSSTHVNANITNNTRSAAMSITSNTDRPHSALVVSEWEKLSQHINVRAPIIVDGSSLDVATTVAVGRHGVRSILSEDPTVRNRIDDSVRFLDEHLEKGNTVYGKRVSRCL